jgi:hypothetical protein
MPMPAWANCDSSPWTAPSARVAHAALARLSRCSCGCKKAGGLMRSQSGTWRLGFNTVRSLSKLSEPRTLSCLRLICLNKAKRGSLPYHAAGSALTFRKAHVNSRVNSDTSRFLNASRSSAVLHTGAFVSSTPQWPARSGTHSLVVVCASCPGTKSSSTRTRSSYQISPL